MLETPGKISYIPEPYQTTVSDSKNYRPEIIA